MKKVVLVLLGLFMLVGGLFAQVEVSKTGKGDMLIYPFFYADGDYFSRVWITNTSGEYSVVYKVVINSGNMSQELRDFYVYLSPHDVTYFDIKCDDMDTCYVTSADDSICDPMDFDENGKAMCGEDFADLSALFESAAPCGDIVNMGYIVAFPVAKYDYEYLKQYDGKLVEGEPVDKTLIVTAFKMDGYKAVLGKGSTVADNLNSLFGKLELMNNSGTFYAVYSAIALTDYFMFPDCQLTPGSPARFTDLAALREGGACVPDISEVENAIMKANIYFINPKPEENMLSIVTFPTKEVKVDKDKDGNCIQYEPFGTFYKCNDNVTKVEYKFTAFNSKEETLYKKVSGGKPSKFYFTYEVNFVLEGNKNKRGFTCGYNVISFVDYENDNDNNYCDNIEYIGAPAVAIGLLFDGKGNESFINPAYDVISKGVIH